jgi:hypothetical protein
VRLQQLSTWKYPNEALLDQFISAMITVTRILNDEAKKSDLGSRSDLLNKPDPSYGSISSVELDLPNILFCDCGEDNCDHKP